MTRDTRHATTARPLFSRRAARRTEPRSARRADRRRERRRAVVACRVSRVCMLLALFAPAAYAQRRADPTAEGVTHCVRRSTRGGAPISAPGYASVVARELARRFAPAPADTAARVELSFELTRTGEVPEVTSTAPARAQRLALAAHRAVVEAVEADAFGPFPAAI